MNCTGLVYPLYTTTGSVIADGIFVSTICTEGLEKSLAARPYLTDVTASFISSHGFARTESPMECPEIPQYRRYSEPTHLLHIHACIHATHLSILVCLRIRSVSATGIFAFYVLFPGIEFFLEPLTLCVYFSYRLCVLSVCNGLC